jgi:hypothetical protein
MHFKGLPNPNVLTRALVLQLSLKIFGIWQSYSAVRAIRCGYREIFHRSCTRNGYIFFTFLTSQRTIRFSTTFRMKSSTAFFIVTAASVSNTLAAPTAVQKTSFVETCTNIRLQWVQKWVTAECLTGNGEERLTSTVYLATKIQDHSGWSSDAIDLKVSDETLV